ncbi:MAG: T9SS type A sorting domain-containing protein [Bacteroidetes bacterium]|nr:T9SS type A sorting domain-containing protein [Bacteroidota bacterium]
MQLRFYRHFLFFYFLLALSFNSLAQPKNTSALPFSNQYSAAKQSANNSRSDTIDILNYQINLSITNFTTRIISGNCLVKFQSKLNGVSELNLDLLKLTVDSVVQHQQQQNISYNDTLLKINLIGPLAANDVDSVTVYYHGIPQIDASAWGGFYFTPTYAYNLGVGFDANPHNYGRVWFPCFDNFVERSTYDFNITTASGKKAACNGQLLNHTLNSNTTETWSWRLSETIPTYLACVAISAYKTVHQTFSGINGPVPVELEGVATDTNNIKASFVNLESAFDTYEQRFGPYQWNKVGYSFVPFNSGAMEHATNITYPRSFANGSLTYEDIMAHEFSHHWWGDLVTCKTAEDMWINEGMASYSEDLFVENLYGKQQYISYVKNNLTEILHFAHLKEGGYRAISGVPHEFTYGDHVYLKGKAVAHALRGYMGDSLFFVGLKAFLANRKFTAVTSYDMRDELELATGLNLHAFFDNWVFAPGFPHFSIDSVVVSKTALSYAVGISVKQKLCGAPAYYSNVPLQITFLDSAWNKHSGIVLLNDKDSTYQDTLPFNPIFTAVNFNQKLSDAISSESKVLKVNGLNNFSNAFMSITVQNIVDSAFLRIEHNWVAPDSLKDANKHYKLSPNRYWKVDGIVKPGFVASAKINYDGRSSAFTGNNYLDNLLITGKEDSLILVYRINSGADWLEYPYFTKLMGNVNDKAGSITLDSLKFGEYALALKNGPLKVVAQTKYQNSDYRIYPNPAGDKLNIELLQNSNNNSDIDINDSSLKLYESYHVDKDQKQLTVSTADWPNGIYFVIITHHVTQQTIMQKVVINHRLDARD